MTDNYDRKKMLRCVLFTFFVSGCASQPLGSFIPFLRDAYGFSYDVSGILLSCQSVGNLITILLTGFLPYYIGRRKTVLCTGIWMVVAYIIFLSGLGSPALMIIAFTMTGLARGGNSNFSNTMVSTLPGDEAARGVNLLHGCFAVGALLSPILLVMISSAWPRNGWRIMAGLLAALCVVQYVIYLVMPVQEVKQEKKGTGSIDRGFLKSGSFWLGMIMLFFYMSTEYAIVGWLVTYFQDMGLLSDNVSQLMSSLLWALMFVGRMLGAYLIGKVSKEKILLADGIGVCAFFMLMFFSRSPALIFIGIIGVGLFMATIYTCAFSFGCDSVKGNDLGCSMLIFGGSAGGIITPALVGLVAEHSGISAGMGLVAAYTGLLMLSIIVAVCLKKKQTKV